MKRAFAIRVFLLLVCMTIITGCGKGGNDPEPTEQPEKQIDWKTEGFKASETMEEKQLFWIEKNIPWNYEAVTPDIASEQLSFVTGTYASCFRGGKIYRLHSVIRPPQLHAVRWVLEIYDTETGNVVNREISYEQLEQKDSGNTFIVAMDVMDDDHLVFEWVEMEWNDDGFFHQTADRMIFLDSDGGVQVVDLWDLFLEKGIVRENFSEVMLLPEGYCVCDSAGNIYAKAGIEWDGFTKLYVIDREGNIIVEHQTAADEVLGEPMRTESGEFIYPAYDHQKKCYRFLWADTENRQMRVVGEMNGEPQINQLFGMQGNDIYYETDQGIVKWNILSGNRTLVFSYRENAIGGKYDPVMVLRKGQNPILWLKNGQEEMEWLSVLDTKPKAEEKIRVADLVDGNPGSRQVSECTALLMRKDLNQALTYEKGTSEGYRSRILAELVEGEGPDILYVSMSDMEMLYEKGLLLDVRELISQETYDKLLPGAIGLGTIEGKLVGIPGNVTATTITVPKDVWAEDSWDLEDMIELMEDDRLEPSIYYSATETYFAPQACMIQLTRYSLNHSFLIDWDKRESHFDDERFLRLLEVTNVSMENRKDESKPQDNDKRATFFALDSVDSICSFGIDMYKTNSSFVGFPTNGTSGNYLNTKGVLVVNANTKNAQKIGAYLECFLSEEIQKISWSNVVHSALSACRLSEYEIETLPEGGQVWCGQELPVTEDGTVSIDKAGAFLESCVPAPKEYPELSAIILEELEAMYAGDKSPGQVAQNIDHRIQLFLDE